MHPHKFARTLLTLSLLMCYGITGCTVTPPPKPPPKGTLGDFLGFGQIAAAEAAKLDALINANGKAPKLERKPPLKRLADAANLESDVPAIKKAAEIKKQEDMAPQKIKAVRYLARIGCGCYDRDDSISEALLAALDDCTEEVRLVAVEAIHDAAEGGECQQCNAKSCCSKKVLERLSQMAYELNDYGCPVEPSLRVREAAVEALAVCCPNCCCPGDYMEAEVVPPEPEETPEEVKPELTPKETAPETEPAEKSDTTTQNSSKDSHLVGEDPQFFPQDVSGTRISPIQSQSIELDPQCEFPYCERGNAWKSIGEYQKAIADFTESISRNPEAVPAYNNRAWLLATCPDPKHRNGQQAVLDARKACELTSWTNWTYIDTLATAFAAYQDFTEAVLWQQKAIAMAPPSAKAKLTARLDLFKTGQAYREQATK